MVQLPTIGESSLVQLQPQLVHGCARGDGAAGELMRGLTSPPSTPRLAFEQRLMLSWTGVRLEKGARVHYVNSRS